MRTSVVESHQGKNPGTTAIDDGRTVDRDDASRRWPRCEPGFTHFELGATSDPRPTAVMAKRYTPKPGVRKD